METTTQEAKMFRGLPLQTREISNCQNRIKVYYRYGNTGPWYRSISTAQIALQTR